jgi:hypothetical protein
MALGIRQLYKGPTEAAGNEYHCLNNNRLRKLTDTGTDPNERRWKTLAGFLAAKAGIPPYEQPLRIRRRTGPDGART